MRATVVLALSLLMASAVLAQVAPNSPQDRMHALTPEQLAENERALAPYIQTARETYPAARTKFLAGLPPGEHFFVVTRLVDSLGHWEQVFILVRNISDRTITGTISSTIALVSGFKQGQSYSFKESALIDWMISKPDGSEEGNAVGKFLDTLDQ